MLILAMPEITVGHNYNVSLLADAVILRNARHDLRHKLICRCCVNVHEMLVLTLFLVIVSTDIIRRIMKYYFKYNVKYVMNVTDGR